MRILWHVGFYDGPLTGICELDGRKHWFRIAENSPEENRVFEIVYLTDKQLNEENLQHDLFSEHVGSHCDYDENGERNIGSMKPQSEWKKFYSSEPMYRAYEDQSVVAVVTESELRGWKELPKSRKDSDSEVD